MKKKSNGFWKVSWQSLLLLCMTLTAFSQTRTISGSVTDSSNSPLPNVSVRVKGTNNGTTTNGSGSFSLTVSSTNAVLTFSYTGMETEEVTVGNQANIHVQLKPTSGTLNEVVVIGYGTARKKDVVGSVNVVAAKDAGATTATSPSQLLVGKAPGVQVVQTSGVPGAGAQIIIRGTGTFTSLDPLYVIDGIQGDGNLFNAINPQDIENITILKDAASTAIYGTRAANGVVIVTTKRAKSGAPRITFSSQVGVSKAWRQLDFLKAKDYVDLVKDVATTQNVALPEKFNTPNVLIDSTDWQDAIFRTALSSQNYINLSGGTDKFLYNFSTGYITQQSIVEDYNLKRLNARLSLEENMGRFRFGQTINIRYTHTSGSMAGLLDAAGFAPYKPILDPNIPGGYSIVSNVEDLNNTGNPLQRVNLTNPVNNEYVFYPQLFAEVNLVKGLKFRSQFSASIGSTHNSDFQKPFMGSNYLYFDRQATEGYSNYSNYILENYFSYNKTFGKHNISATLGNSYIDPGKYSSLNASGSNIANDIIQNLSVATTQTVTGASSGYASPAVISYYGRLIYTFDNKYILSGSMRRDGSSVFGENNRFGNFPGVGFAWKFSEENFIKNNLSFINDGKLRIGWGRTGNDNIGAFRTSTVTYAGSPGGNLVYSLGTGENFVPGVTVNAKPNPDLKWEQTSQADIGLDLAFLKNKLNVTIDWYKRRNEDLLVNVSIPTDNGVGGVGYVSSSIPANAATAENKGIEFSVAYTNNAAKGKFNYTVSVNGALNKNNVISLGDQFQAPIRDGAFFTNPAITYTAAGYPVGSFYGFTVDHVATDQNEIGALNAAAQKTTGDPNAVYQSGLLPGDFIFKDVNGDGVLTDADQSVLGNPMPKFMYGFNGSASFKNFDFNVVVAGVSGLSLVNANRYFTLFADRPHNATTAILNRWKQPSDVAPLPRAGQNAVSNLRPSTFFIEDCAYLRIRNVTLGYTIPFSALHNLTNDVISSLRFYVAAENLVTITNYTGYDPEVSGQSGNLLFQRGIDNAQLPQPRTFLVGLQLGF